MVGLLALTYMNNLSSALAQMHLEGGVSGSVQSIAAPKTNDVAAEAVRRSWFFWERHADLNDQALPGDVAAWWLLLDSIVLAPCIFLLLVGMANRRAVVGSKLHEWLRLAANWLAPTYLILDLFENASTGLEIFGPGWHSPVRALSGVKLVAFAGCALPIVVSLIAPSQVTGSSTPIRPVISRLRVGSFVVGLFAVMMLALPGNVRPQLNDVFRTLTLFDDRVAFLSAVCAVVALATAVWLSGSLAAARCDYSHRSRTAVIVFVGAVVLLALWPVMGWFAYTSVVVFVIALVNLIASKLHPASVRGTGQQDQSVASDEFDLSTLRALAAISVAPLVILAIAIARASDLLGGGKSKAWSIAVPLMLYVVAIALWSFAVRRRTLRKVDACRMKRQAVSLGLLGVAAGAIVTVLGVWPLGAGWGVGSIAALVIALTFGTALLSATEHLAWGQPTGIFGFLGLRRVPVISVSILIALTAGQFDQRVEYHRARIVGGSESSTPQPGVPLSSIATAVASRESGGRSAAAASLSGQSHSVQPLIIVVASGGGARAAYWTSLVTNCLFARQTPSGVRSPPCDGEGSWDDVVIASGASGGSVGLAMFDAAQRHRDPAAEEQATQRGALDVHEVFRDGFLDPVMASLIARDATFNVYRKAQFDDRAAALEEALEARVPGLAEGLFATQIDAAGAVRLPVLSLASVSTRDGCRLNVSVLDLSPDRPGADGVSNCTPRSGTAAVSGTQVAPATWDVADFVCADQDMNLSTAAVLSARFPFVSPSGALEVCGGDAHVFGVDGGYFDASAASVPSEIVPVLVDEIERNNPGVCVQPVAIQIDNGYLSTATAPQPTRPLELLAPLTALGAVRSRANDRFREELAVATAMRCGDVEPRVVAPTYIHVVPQSRPGLEAPLGWALSEGARDSLDRQLSGRHNLQALCAAQRWLSSAEWWEVNTCQGPPNPRQQGEQFDPLTTSACPPIAVVVILAALAFAALAVALAAVAVAVAWRLMRRCSTDAMPPSDSPPVAS